MKKTFHVLSQGVDTDTMRELPVEKQRLSWTSSKDYETLFEAIEAFEYATYCEETAYARLECPNGDLYQFSNGKYRNKQLKEGERL
jgi:hypothetical protein